MSKTLIAQQLREIGAIKYGNFTLKSGVSSPIYIDLRTIISYPTLLMTVAEQIWQSAQRLKAPKADYICGVPYTALPIATAISIANNIPMVMVRKEAKSYGTKQMVEGNFSAGQRCIIIEDVVTSGQSVLAAVSHLREAGLEVSSVLSLVDREQGGKANLAEAGCELQSVFYLNELLSELSPC